MAKNQAKVVAASVGALDDFYYEYSIDLFYKIS